MIEDLPITDLTTDACIVGAGAHFRGDWVFSSWDADFPEFAHSHINFKEVLAAYLAITRWCTHWQNHHIIIFTDNQAAMCILNKGSTRNPAIMKVLRHIFWLSATLNFRITARYIAGKENSLRFQFSSWIWWFGEKRSLY